MRSHAKGVPSYELAFGCALVGFFAGVAVALALTQIGNTRVIGPAEMHLLWPTASFGLEFADWSDGNGWHFLRLLAVFLGNGFVYSVAAACFGALVTVLRR